LGNALSEASFLIDLERNADIVSMVSYAPLFGRQDHSIWKPNLIWFDGTRVYGTPSYYVQQMFSLNRGDFALPAVTSLPASSSILYSSASLVPSRGQVIVKAVNKTPAPVPVHWTLDTARGFEPNATAIVLSSSNASDTNSLNEPTKVAPVTNVVSVDTLDQYVLPPNSVTVLRLQELPDDPVRLDFAGGAGQRDLISLGDGFMVQLSSFITNTVSVHYSVDSPEGILAGGTVQFVPGDLARTIPLLLTNLETHSLVRLTLDNPINGQLGGVTRVYYVSSSAGSGAPTLGLARFTDETVLYWADAASRLQEAVELTGAWTAVTNASSPIRLSFPEPQRFYRLKR
jgi:hypothetical protein